jgi:hypothetical protein
MPATRMAAIEDNRKAIASLLDRRAYLESKIAGLKAVGRNSYGMETELTAIDYGVSALEFVISTLEYEAKQVPRSNEPFSV